MEEKNYLTKAYEKYKAQGGLLSQNEIDNIFHSWELLTLKIFGRDEIDIVRRDDE